MRSPAPSSGRATAARLALVDGMSGAVWARGIPRVGFDFTVVDGLVVGIDLLAEAGVLTELDLAHLDD